MGGVDTHRDTHCAAVIDMQGRALGTATFPVSAEGYRRLHRWLAGFGSLDRVGVESSGGYGAGLVRHLGAVGVRVLEVNRCHAHTRHRQGKDDRIDALMAARHVLAGVDLVLPKRTDGAVEALRVVRVARAGAIKARSAAFCQLDQVIVSAPQALREHIAQAGGRAARVRVCAALRPDMARLQDSTQATKLALAGIARRIRLLTEEIECFDRELTCMIGTLAPRTLALVGVGPEVAGQLLVSAGENIERLHGEAAFAALCGVSPLPAGSGRTDGRHRLSRSGDRQANRALHIIALARLSHCDTTRAYMARRLAQGKSKREVIRCLKRYIAREVFGVLLADLRSGPHAAGAAG